MADEDAQASAELRIYSQYFLSFCSAHGFYTSVAVRAPAF